MLSPTSPTSLLSPHDLATLTHSSHLSLCEVPSPIRSLPNLSIAARSHQDTTTQIYLKDDSELSSLYGGNKARKLEWILGDAIACGAESVWTSGGLGSHHALATALYADQLGLKSHILHVSQPLTPHALSVLAQISETSASLTLASPPRAGERPSASYQRQLQAWLPSASSFEGRHPLTAHARPSSPFDATTGSYYIPAGGSSLLGALGYVAAGLELSAQIARGDTPKPDVIYMATGTGSTLAGLTLGLHLAGVITEVIGVAVVPKYLISHRRVIHQIERCAEWMSQRFELGSRALTQDAWRVSVLRGYLGAGYGAPSEAGRAAAELSLEDQLSLDPIYTAKAMAALLERERGRGRIALFWQTLATQSASPRFLQESVAESALSRLPSPYRSLL